MQQSVLEDLSDYFVSAIKHSHLGGGQQDFLRFPMDDLNSWSVLLYWKMKGHIPSQSIGTSEEALTILMRSWVLGERYNLPFFQDMVMLELLNVVDSSWVPVSLVKEGFEGTPPHSKLRGVLAEEAFWWARYGRCNADEDVLDECDGVIGFASALMTVVLEGEKQFPCPRLPRKGHNCHYRWRGHMLGDIPSSHWVHTQASEGVPEWKSVQVPGHGEGVKQDESLASVMNRAHIQPAGLMSGQD